MCVLQLLPNLEHYSDWVSHSTYKVEGSSSGGSSSTSSSSSSSTSSSTGSSSAGSSGASVAVDDEDVQAKGMADDFIRTPFGVIRYYTYKPGEPFVVAHCTNELHGRACRRTKCTYGNARRPGQGRPIGFLYHWLEEHGVSKLDHSKSRSGTAGNLRARTNARKDFLELPRGSFFANKVERPNRVGEPDEPTTLP